MLDMVWFDWKWLFKAGSHGLEVCVWTFFSISWTYSCLLPSHYFRPDGAKRFAIIPLIFRHDTKCLYFSGVSLDRSFSLLGRMIT
jgi:hypothetical protein